MQILKQAFRMWEWLLVTAVLFAIVWWIAPQQIELLFYKAVQVTIGTFIGYWLDKSLYRGASPDRFLGHRGGEHSDYLAGKAMIRRALIVVGTIFAISHGL